MWEGGVFNKSGNTCNNKHMLRGQVGRAITIQLKRTVYDLFVSHMSKPEMYRDKPYLVVFCAFFMLQS